MNMYVNSFARKDNAANPETDENNSDKNSDTDSKIKMTI